MTCARCGRELTSDEIGATKKLVNRGATEFLCVPCLAGAFRVSEDMIRQRIEHFRATGCTLFAPRSDG